MSRSLPLFFCFGLIWTGILAGCNRQSATNNRNASADDRQSAIQVITPLSDTLTTPALHPTLASAIQDSFRQAMNRYRIDPENNTYFLNLATATAATGDFREALTLYGEGVFKFPEDPRVFLGRSIVWMQLRELQNAQNDIQMALERAEDSTQLMDFHAGTDPDRRIFREILQQTAFLHLMQGQYDDAAARLGQASDLRRDAKQEIRKGREAALEGEVALEVAAALEGEGASEGEGVSEEERGSGEMAAPGALAEAFWTMIAHQRSGDLDTADQILRKSQKHPTYGSGPDSWGSMQEQNATEANRSTPSNVEPLWMNNPAFSGQHTDVYAALFSLFAGDAEPDLLLNHFWPASQTTFELLHHGLAYWHLHNGRETQAIQSWESILDTSETHFGHLYLLAETNLANSINP